MHVSRGVYINIYIYIYIVIHKQAVSLYHNSSVWPDILDAMFANGLGDRGSIPG